MLTNEEAEIEKLKKENADLEKTKKSQDERITKIKDRAMSEIHKLQGKVKHLSSDNVKLHNSNKHLQTASVEHEKTEALLRKKLREVGSALESEQEVVQKMMTDIPVDPVDSSNATSTKSDVKVEIAVNVPTAPIKTEKHEVVAAKAEPVKVAKAEEKPAQKDDDETLSLESDDEPLDPLEPAQATAEPVKAEPVKAEPVKAEPVKVEPVKVAPVKAEPKVEAATPKVTSDIAKPVKVKVSKEESKAADGLKGLESEVENLEQAVDSAETPADAPAESQSLLDDASSTLEQAMND